MDSDAILTAVNAVESITSPPHTPERSSYRARKTVEQIIHLIFLLCGIVAVAFVLLISIYLIISGLPAIRQIGLLQFLLRQGLGPHQHHHRRTVRNSALYPDLRLRHCRGHRHRRARRTADRHISGEGGPAEAGGGDPHGGAAAGGHPVGGVRPGGHDRAGAGHPDTCSTSAPAPACWPPSSCWPL